MTPCYCEFCSPTPAETYTAAFRQACEVRYLAAFPERLDRKRYLAGVPKRRAAELIAGLKSLHRERRAV